MRSILVVHLLIHLYVQNNPSILWICLVCVPLAPQTVVISDNHLDSRHFTAECFVVNALRAYDMLDGPSEGYAPWYATLPRPRGVSKWWSGAGWRLVMDLDHNRIWCFLSVCWNVDSSMDFRPRCSIWNYRRGKGRWSELQHLYAHKITRPWDTVMKTS